MKKTIKLLALSALTLASCTKEAVNVDHFNEKSLSKSGKIILGEDNTTRQPIIATYHVGLFEGGNHGVGFKHIHYVASTHKGHQVEFNAILGEDEELILIGDLISIGFEDGECYWCECMTGIGGAVEDADATGGVASAAFGAYCPQCVLVAAAMAASYCAGSALSPF